jgi:hypothetical protein
MVIGERFAWGHIPKTGGDATQALFGLFPELIVSADPHDTNRKHSLFRDREAEVAGKLLALNIRRLPSWVLSRTQHEATRGVYPEYRPLPMQSPHRMADTQFPDGWISYFTGNGRLSIGRWLRMEFLAEDFLDFISEFTDVAEEKRSQVLEIGRVNQVEYDHEVLHWFTESQVRRMYENNPLWHAVEKEVYREWPRLG